MAQEGEVPILNPFLIDKIPYTQHQSPEFDALLKSKGHIIAPQNSLSIPTKDKVLVSGWHVPCHCIITRTEDGTLQAFHVQPNKMSASLLTLTQEQTLKAIGQQNAKAIATKSKRSWFSIADERELEGFRIQLERVIDVDTSNWWRLLYDPQVNEIWVDIQDKKLLIKYKGFQTASR